MILSLWPLKASPVFLGHGWRSTLSFSARLFTNFTVCCEDSADFPTSWATRAECLFLSYMNSSSTSLWFHVDFSKIWFCRVRLSPRSCLEFRGHTIWACSWPDWLSNADALAAAASASLGWKRFHSVHELEMSGMHIAAPECSFVAAFKVGEWSSELLQGTRV